MRKALVVLCIGLIILAIGGNSSAFFIDFENGTNGATVSDINGISFHDFNGYTSLYGDSSTGLYNTVSDDLGLSWRNGYFHHDGYLWMWTGPQADARGVIIDFINNDGTWFTTGYNSYATFYVEAYLTNGMTVTVSGESNVMNPMSYLTVHALADTYIDYIILRHNDIGNSWLADNMSGDASGVGESVPAPDLPATSSPEPSSIWLCAIGLICAAAFRHPRVR